MSIPYVRASWDATVLDDLFDHYDLERTQDGGSTFQPIGFVTTEDVTELWDFEAVRGAEVGYRLRVVRIDGAVSDWTATEVETVPLNEVDFDEDGNAGGWHFVSNEAPYLNLDVTVWSDTKKRHTWEHPANEELLEISGRPGRVALKAMEPRYDRFELAVFQVRPGMPGRAAVDPLLDLTEAALNYVAVHSPEGRTWYANLTAEETEQSEGRKVYTTPVEVAELTRVPTVIDVVEVT